MTIEDINVMNKARNHNCIICNYVMKSHNRHNTNMSRIVHSNCLKILKLSKHKKSMGWYRKQLIENQLVIGNKPVGNFPNPKFEDMNKPLENITNLLEVRYEVMK